MHIFQKKVIYDKRPSRHHQYTLYTGVRESLYRGIGQVIRESPRITRYPVNLPNTHRLVPNNSVPRRPSERGALARSQKFQIFARAKTIRKQSVSDTLHTIGSLSEELDHPFHPFGRCFLTYELAPPSRKPLKVRN